MCGPKVKDNEHLPLKCAHQPQPPPLKNKKFRLFFLEIYTFSPKYNIVLEWTNFPKSP